MIQLKHVNYVLINIIWNNYINELQQLNSYYFFAKYNFITLIIINTYTFVRPHLLSLTLIRQDPLFIAGGQILVLRTDHHLCYTITSLIPKVLFDNGF